MDDDTENNTLPADFNRSDSGSDYELTWFVLDFAF